MPPLEHKIKPFIINMLKSRIRKEGRLIIDISRTFYDMTLYADWNIQRIRPILKFPSRGQAFGPDRPRAARHSDKGLPRAVRRSYGSLVKGSWMSAASWSWTKFNFTTTISRYLTRSACFHQLSKVAGFANFIPWACLPHWPREYRPGIQRSCPVR